jgi:hypothetical protein
LLGTGLLLLLLLLVMSNGGRWMLEVMGMGRRMGVGVVISRQRVGGGWKRSGEKKVGG